MLASATKTKFENITNLTTDNIPPRLANAVLSVVTNLKIMQTLIIPRGKGKTLELIKRSAITKEYIVCINLMEVKNIENTAKELNLKIPQPITFSDFRDRKYYGKGIRGFLIDNADLFLQSLTNVPINSITVSS